jgi:hypothetical protein
MTEVNVIAPKIFFKHRDVTNVIHIASSPKRLRINDCIGHSETTGMAASNPTNINRNFPNLRST